MNQKKYRLFGGLIQKMKYLKKNTQKKYDRINQGV